MSLSAGRSPEAAATRETSVVVPLELQDVIVGLRDKAKQGNPQAAAQLLAWLTRFPPQLSQAVEEGKALEDMTPDELAFAEAWALRQIARAQRKLHGIRGTFALDHTAAQNVEATPRT
jgi:hypothetical protein